MKTCNSSNRWVRFVATVGCVLTVSAGAHGGGQPEANLADRINKRLTKGRVVNVEPPLLEAPVIPLSLLEAFPNADPDLFETMPVGLPIVTIEFPNNEAVAAGLVDGRGVSATGGSGETMVFYQPNDSGFGWFMKNDDVGNYETWAMQAILGNGFEAGLAISGYSVLIYNSASSINEGSWDLQLWDGDPIGVCDIDNDPAGTPIPGTQASFGPLPHALDICPSEFGNGETECVGLYRLRVTLATKVTIPNDRVFIGVTMTEGCRAGWRIAGSGGSAWNEPPWIGSGDCAWVFYACEQFGDCGPPPPFNPNVCVCDDGAPCDHTDGTYECAGEHATFCGDGYADYIHYEGGWPPDSYGNFVASVFAPTDIAMEWSPKRATSKSGGGDVPSEVIGNEIILYQGGVNVMLELQVNDWSGPDGTTRLRAFDAALDIRGYSNGLGGALTEKLIPCTSTEECVAAFGGICSFLGNACRQDDDCSLFPFEACDGSTCLRNPSRLEGYCAPVYVAIKRPDFCLAETDKFVGADVTSPAYRFGATAFDRAGKAFGDLDLTAKDGKAYMGTLWLEVPDDAKGSYTVGLRPAPVTRLLSQRPPPDEFIPLVGQIPAKITVLDCTGLDCQPNGIRDDCEIQRGLTADCNGNQIPDDCEADCDGNGVADDCEEDSDGDGVIDACDGCPDDADMISPGVCGCGVSDVDSDLDTVPDCVDQCPGMDDRIDDDEDGTPDCLDPVPTLSAWGLMIFALLLLAGGKIYFGRCRAATP